MRLAWVLLFMPGIAHAHGDGLFLAFVGMPFLALLFVAFLAWQTARAGRGGRLWAFCKNLLLAPLWLFVFIAPWFNRSLERVLSPYEVAWTFLMPVALFLASLWLSARRRRRAGS
ncbi:hypothetical protein [Chitinolyticbacter albus]|uniref:hypothetical protein n=1 Tax=Chitinolyticbacter albus TaxID=2961951 RepID=UPI00210D7E52|nr:hypothetical protein [Chitinolyticbacter albus]